MADDKKTPGSQAIDPENLKTVNELTKQIAGHVSETTDDFRQQAQIIAGLRDSFTKMAENVGSAATGMRSMSSEQLEQINEATKKAAGEMSKFDKGMSKTAATLGGKFVRSATVAAGVMTGLFQGFKNFYSILKVGAGLVTGAVSGMFSLGKAILAIPLNIFKTFVDMADKGGGGNELFMAYEKVREEFGAFKSVTSSAVISVSKGMMGMSEGGLNSMRVFGNLAEIMTKVTALATAMGPQFTKNADEFMKNGKAILYYQKGLGITDEQMSSIAVKAGLMGETITKQLNDMTKQSYAMAKAFGLDAKVISKDMGKAMSDVAHFGHLSQKELAVAVTYSNKLGVSIDKLTGLMDKFNTFDSAAESASALGEQFGVNIDAMQLMSAQNPAEKMDILKKAFAATGKDLSKLSYQERSFIQQQTSLDAATFDAAMSQKNATVSLDKMAQAAEKAETAQLSQTAALKQLAEATARLPGAGSQAKGFFGKLADGFKRGVENSVEFREIMNNITKIFQKFTDVGYKLGQMFVSSFPGVKTFLEGVAKVFDPARYGKMLDRVVALFDKFSKKTGGVTENFKEFMEELKTIFFDFFNEGKPAGKQVLEGLKKFWLFVGKGIWEGVKWAWGELGKIYDKIHAEIANPSKSTQAFMDGIRGFMQKVADFITKTAVPFMVNAVKGLTEWLRNPEKTILPKGSGDKFIDNLTSMFAPLGTALKNAFFTLLPVIKDLIAEFVSKIPGMLYDAWMAQPWYMKLYSAMPVIGNTFQAVLSQYAQKKVIDKAISSALGDAVKNGAADAAVNAEKIAAEQGAGFAQKFFPTFTKGFSNIASKFGGGGGIGSSIVGMLTTDVGALFAGGGAGAAAAVAGPIAAAVGGIWAGVKIGDALVESGKKEAKEVSEAVDKSFELIGNELDPNKKIEMLKKIKAENEAKKKDEQGLGKSMWNSTFGQGATMENEYNNAVLKADREIKQIEADQKRLLDERTEGTEAFKKKQAMLAAKAEKEEAERRLAQVGPVTIDNAAERFKKIDELAKQVMGKDFDIQKKLDDVKKKLDGITWGIISEQQEKEMNKSFLALQRVQGIMASIADIGGLVKVAGDKMQSMGDALSNNSPLMKNFGDGGPISKLAKMISQETFKDVNLQDFTASEAKTKGVHDVLDRLKKLIDALMDVKASFDKFNFGDSFSSKMGEISKAFGVLGTATDTISKMKTAASAASAAMDEGLHKSMGQVAAFFWKLISEPYGDAKMGPISSIIWSIDAIGKMLSGQKVSWQGKEYSAGGGLNVAAATTSISAFFKNIFDVATSIKGIAEMPMSSMSATTISGIANSVTQFVTSKSDDGKNIFEAIAAATKAATAYSPEASKRAFSEMRETLQQAQKLIDQVNEFNKVLAGEGANPMKIKHVLGSLANNVGLGAGGKYEIKNRDVVIKVDLAVVMEAGKVENVILQRADSVIRDKINTLATFMHESKQVNDVSQMQTKTSSGYSAAVQDSNFIHLYGINSYDDAKYPK